MNIIKKNIPLSERPYRSCVGLMVFNKDGNVFCGQRLDNKAEAWQLPQGGIDKGELPIEAGYRELKEETSIINVEFVGEYPEWLNYDIPLPLADNLWKGEFRGQTQRWLLFHFMGEDKEIDINTNKAEFLDWKWVDIDQLTDLVVDFKLDVYKRLKLELKNIISN